MSTAAQYLQTLQRIPDDVILSMATRPIDLPHFAFCVCGWAASETHARLVDLDAEAVVYEHDGIDLLVEQYGGDEHAEWKPINHAYTSPGNSAALEEAFMERVLEAVG